ncbi:hypothetical protein PIB30_011902 [Stylosanthes scabra]|uniref:Uncharacterized protein n=1 Tax=Stylosanthes scabra TaxID=79078 RepID=A0ABU6V892_9FABA|nr:hypothetical protein [Stylosanthes scabra]
MGDQILPQISILDCATLGCAQPLAAPNLEELHIVSCEEIDSFPQGGLPQSLKTLEIDNCQKLARRIASKGLQSEGLTSLSLSSWDDAKSFPTQACLPASIESLVLSKFPNLETLDCKGLEHLTSLKLRIEECPNLENITQETLPASITQLNIKENCPLARKLKEMNNPRIQFETVRNCTIM